MPRTARFSVVRMAPLGSGPFDLAQCSFLLDADRREMKLPRETRQGDHGPNGIFGCKDEAAKSPLETTLVDRDQKLPRPLAQMPAQTAYLNLARNCPVRIDWIVGAPGLEP
jgi:hypothetical protein